MEIRETARKYGILPAQICNWRSNYAEIKLQAEKSPTKLPQQPGGAVENTEQEESLEEWVQEQRFAELAMSPQEIINLGMSQMHTFRDGDEKKLKHLAAHFMSRSNLCMCNKTNVSQIIDPLLQKGKQKYFRRVMTMFKNRIRKPKLLCDMDQTLVYMNCTPCRTVYKKGARTVSIKVGGTKGLRSTVAVTVAMDGTKLPLFVMFNGKTGGRIDRSLKDITPSIIVCGVQEKHGWMHP